MSPEELAAIRDRSAATLTVNTASVQDYLTARDDRRVLLVEVDRLNGVLAQVRADNQLLGDLLHQAHTGAGSGES